MGPSVDQKGHPVDPFVNAQLSGFCNLIMLKNSGSYDGENRWSRRSGYKDPGEHMVYSEKEISEAGDRKDGLIELGWSEN